MSKRGVTIYFNEQASEDLHYAFERMKAFGLIPTQTEDIGKFRAQVIGYVLNYFVQHEQVRLADIEDLERNESALESAISNASGGAWRGEEAQAEDAEYLAELWDELHETRRELGKL